MTGSNNPIKDRIARYKITWRVSDDSIAVSLRFIYLVDTIFIINFASM
jgi:hypothetical protein